LHFRKYILLVALGINFTFSLKLPVFRMTISDKKPCHIIFAAIVVALTVFKWHDFYLPYFWDELGVYAQAVDYQFQHNISLMPGSVPGVLSRGHPLLFTFMNACVMRVFGEQPLVAHLFCFSISVFLLCAVYIKIGRYFNPKAGLVSALILAVQPVFLAQSGLLIPEITLALFIFLALCSYYEKSFFLFSVFVVMAVLTKEAAIVLPVTVLAYSILTWVLRGVKPKGLSTSGVVLTIVPYLVFGLFLLLQKHQNGWYFFPMHIKSVSFGLENLLCQMARFKFFIFFAQGRKLWSFLLLTGAVFALLTGKWRMERIVNSFVFLLFLLVISFSAMGLMVDLYLDRYLMMLVIAYCIFTGVAICSISGNRLFLALVILLAVLVSSENLESGKFNYDADLGYRRQVYVLAQAVNSLFERTKPGDRIYANFPGYFAIVFQQGGYWPAGKANDVVLSRENGYYLILCNPGADLPVSASSMKLLSQFNDGYAHAEVFWVKD
jgi:4-amino-4-deoxy-L-arabinose transferase-like glycosyltransferase